MTQERYQEAAEHYATRARRGRSFAERGASPHLGITEGDIAAVTKAAERDELAAEVLSKLASGWVLVPAEPVAWLYREQGSMHLPPGPWKHTYGIERPFREDDQRFECKALYAAAPKP